MLLLPAGKPGLGTVMQVPALNQDCSATSQEEKRHTRRVQEADPDYLQKILRVCLFVVVGAIKMTPFKFGFPRRPAGLSAPVPGLTQGGG